MAAIDVVKYDGGPDVFAWKFPINNLSTFTQLIVNESQEAVFFRGGQALDLFGPGRHTLENSNIPMLSSLINLPFGGQSIFQAEVWFINKISVLDVKWGTPTPIQVQDPKFKVFVPIRAHGQMGINVQDSRKFLIKLVGTMSMFNRTYIQSYVKGIYLTKVKDCLSSYILKKQVSVMEINAYIDEISQHIHQTVGPHLAEYGINLLNFYVNDISIPENDPAVIQLKGALAKKAEMDIIGYTYGQERSFDTLEGAATNPGSTQSGLMGAGLGLGMGLGVGGTFGQQMGNIGQAINIAPPGIKCPKCSFDNLANSKFCGSCGASFQPGNTSAGKTEVTCTNCGQLFPPTVKFCPNCGDPYNPCSFCGADIKPGSDVCHECGKSLPKPCTKCGALTKTGTTKFCPDCGQSFLKKCSQCSFDVTDSVKFCPNCGNQL